MIDDVFKYPDDSVEGGTAGEALLIGVIVGCRCWSTIVSFYGRNIFFPLLRGLLASTVILCLKLEHND